MSSMYAHLTTNVQGNVIIQMKGALNYENGPLIRRELIEIFTKNPTIEVTVDFQSVDFIGSSGINIFVDTIKYLRAQNWNIKLCNVREEFHKVFKLYNLEGIESIIQKDESLDTDDFGQDLTVKEKKHKRLSNTKLDAEL